MAMPGTTSGTKRNSHLYKGRYSQKRNYRRVLIRSAYGLSLNLSRLGTGATVSMIKPKKPLLLMVWRMQTAA